MSSASTMREATVGNPSQGSVPETAAVFAPPRTSTSIRKPINWVGTMLPTLFIFAALGALAFWGHQNGWKMPKSSALRGETAAKKDDWCAEHNVPESICVECKEDLMPRSKAPKWCRVHGVPECPVHHPELAHVAGEPELPKYDTVAAIKIRERPENDPQCKLHLRRIQFESHAAVRMAGIDTDMVAERPMTEFILASGEIIYDPTRLKPQVTRAAGTVWWAEKTVGQRVREGEVLALIDASEVRRSKADFLQALAEVDLAHKTFKRAESLKGTTSEQDIQRAQAELNKARVNLWRLAGDLTYTLQAPIRGEDFEGLDLKEAERRLRFHGVPLLLADKVQSSSPAVGLALGGPASLLQPADPRTAPGNLHPVRASLSGVVAERSTVVGGATDPSKPLYVVADPESMILVLHIRAEDLKLIKPGLEVRFRPDGGSQEVITQIESVSTAADEKSRLVEVRAPLKNKPGNLRSNTFGTGRIILRHEPDAVTVQNEAVHWDGTCHVVFVRDRDYLKEGSWKVFHVRKVVPGAKDDRFTELLAGVLPGEMVATKGSAALRGELLKADLGEG